jgi:hypothetical protein
MDKYSLSRPATVIAVVAAMLMSVAAAALLLALVATSWYDYRLFAREQLNPLVDSAEQYRLAVRQMQVALLALPGVLVASGALCWWRTRSWPNPLRAVLLSFVALAVMLVGVGLDLYWMLRHVTFVF